MLTGGGGTTTGWNKKILLEDYIVEDSKIDKRKEVTTVMDSEGNPQQIIKTIAEKRLAIRYKKILKTEEKIGDDGLPYESYVFEKKTDRDGNPTLLDAEFYSFTGSKILIDQALNDFNHDDLPAPTVIQQFQGKTGQKFYKFT